MKLTGNTILITGGSSGVGFEMAKELSARGNKIIICGRSEEKLIQIKKQFPDIEVVACDITEKQDRKKLYNFVLEKYPELNVLINNAAIVNRFNFKDDINVLDQIESEIQTNYLAPIALTKSFLPLLEKKKNSKIVNITTGLAYVPKAAYPGYCASKAALHSFSQTLRLQLTDCQTDIIEVLLPVIDTPFHNGNIPEGAITVTEAVNKINTGLESGKSEIRIGKAKLLYYISRIAPTFAFGKVNMQ